MIKIFFVQPDSKENLKHSVCRLFWTQGHGAGVDAASRGRNIREVKLSRCNHFLGGMLEGDGERLAQRVEAGHLHHHARVNIFKAVCANTRGDESVELRLSSKYCDDRWHLKY